MSARSRPETSEFLDYLATRPSSQANLPSLASLSAALGISNGALREQLAVARALGLVDVRPRTGIRRRPFTFSPVMRQTLAYSLPLHQDLFEQFSDLRNNVEIAFWKAAVASLTRADKKQLTMLVQRARVKLAKTPFQVPHEEHRQFHLLIYSRLSNTFVTGILEAYWDMYEAVGLNLYAGDRTYLVRVWEDHARMARAISAGRVTAGRKILESHIGLLAHRRNRNPR